MKKYDGEGGHSAIISLTSGRAWEVVPHATTEAQVDSINQRQRSPEHPFNSIDICDLRVLDEQMLQEILDQCKSTNLTKCEATFEIEQILDKELLFPNDIFIGTIPTPRVVRSPPPARAAAILPPDTVVTVERSRASADGIITTRHDNSRRHGRQA